MKLTNLQMQFHGKDHLEHRITYVNENGTQCRETLCSGEEFAQHVIDCLENAPVLLKERDNALERATNITEYDEGMREAMQQIARACGKTFTVDIGYDNLPELVEELLSRPDTTQPQLSEIRYVLHGDIQPCSVLYSDGTTTLLRLDEGDMMLETDTIEWSDSVTYRCQELLRSTVGETGKQGYRMVNAMAQLVRDERILLNDNGGDDLGDAKGEAIEFTYALYVGECVQTGAFPLSFTNWCDQDKPPHMVADAELVDACHKWESKLSDHLSLQPKQER